MTESKPTFKRQRDKYERRAKLSLYVTGGLGGLGLFGALASNVFQQVPRWLSAIFVTNALTAGASLALAYSAFSWAATIIDRHLEDTGAPEDTPYDRIAFPPPRRADILFKAGQILVVTTGLWLVVAVWWAALTG
jgi:hypothetical protein